MNANDRIRFNILTENQSKAILKYVDQFLWLFCITALIKYSRKIESGVVDPSYKEKS